MTPQRPAEGLTRYAPVVLSLIGGPPFVVSEFARASYASCAAHVWQHARLFSEYHLVRIARVRFVEEDGR